MKLIIGLGNPGKAYEKTRHNIGFILLDYLYESWLKEKGFSKWSENKKFSALISEGKLNSEKIILAKPLTYMNDSGQAVQTLMAYYQIAPADLLVIQDELDLPFGEYKIQTDISSAGHKGIESIIQHIGSQAFTRARLGIGQADKQKQGDGQKYVLKKFGLLERGKLKTLKEKILPEIQAKL